MAVAVAVVVAIAVSARTHVSTRGAAGIRQSPSSLPLFVPTLSPTLVPHVRHRHHRHGPRPRPAHPAQQAAVSLCPSGTPLRGVYHSYRLEVLGQCRRFAGTVIAVRSESDGDHHVIIRPDHGFASMLDGGNYSQQHGGIVAEIMPGQTLLPPYVGEHVAVVGTWAYDTNHAWNEIHPIWAMDYGQGMVKSLPPVTPVYEPGSGGSSGGGSGGSGGGGSGGGENCTPGYSPCLVWHGGADYDCYGGGGNGPYFTAPGVTYRVTGSDPYDLDGNNDGYGCE